MSRKSNPVNTFLQEAEDLLEQIEEIALALSDQPDDSELVNRLFRAFHTIKGSGAMFGFDEVAAFTHHMETALDRVRDGRLAWSRELTELTLASRDYIKALLAGTQESEAGGNIVAALQALTGDAPATDAPAAKKANAAAPADAARDWKIRFQPNPDRDGQRHESGMAAGRAARAGCVHHHRTHRGRSGARPDSAGPLLSVVGDRAAYGRRPRRHSRRVHLRRGRQPGGDRGGGANRRRRRRRLARGPAAENAQRSTAAESTVRVAAEKLDRLVNLVGELVMNQSRLTQAASHVNSAELASPVEEIERLVAELRDNVLGIRMMPIGTHVQSLQAAGARSLGGAGQGNRSGHRGRRDGAGQDGARPARRPAGAPDPQQHRPRHRSAGGARGARQAAAGDHPAERAAHRLERGGEHRGRRQGAGRSGAARARPWRRG